MGKDFTDHEIKINDKKIYLSLGLVVVLILTLLGGLKYIIQIESSVGEVSTKMQILESKQADDIISVRDEIKELKESMSPKMDELLRTVYRMEGRIESLNNSTKRVK